MELSTEPDSVRPMDSTHVYSHTHSFAVDNIENVVLHRCVHVVRSQIKSPYDAQWRYMPGKPDMILLKFTWS